MTEQVLSQWWRRLSSLSSQDTFSTDLVLLCGDGEKVVCHQLVLGLSSPTLYSLMQEQNGENEVVIHLPEVSSRVVRALLAVVYNRYLPSSLEDQQDIDKVAQMLGLRVRHGKSNIVFKCEGNDLEVDNFYEPYLEEKTTFLYVDDVKQDEMLTLDESETYEVQVTAQNTLELGCANLEVMQEIAPADDNIGLDNQHEIIIDSLNANEVEVADNKLIIEEVDMDEKIIIVPIDSQEEVINETIEIDHTVEKIPNHKTSREAKVRKMRSLTCVCCSKSIINHRFKDVVTSKWFYRCCHCSKSNLRSAAGLLKHVSTHVFTKCQLCQKSKFEHKKNKQFFCCQCKKKILGSKLRVHVQKHLAKKQIKCGMCHEEFNSVYKLKEHVSRYHEIKVEYKNILPIISEPDIPLVSSTSTPRIDCPSCSKSMTRRHYTKHHKASCSKERILKCEVCGREGFCNPSTLQDHIRAKHTHERPFKCEYCNKGFPAASHLAHHRMKKHRVNSKGELQPKVVFPCSFCGKILTTKPKLLAHVKVIHQGIKEFTCPTCKKSFSSKSNLDIHIGSVHTGNLPYKCEFCSKSFARKNLLSAHRQTAHQFIEAQSVHSQGAL